MVWLYDWIMEQPDHKARRIVWLGGFTLCIIFWVLVILAILGLSSCVEEAYA